MIIFFTGSDFMISFDDFFDKIPEVEYFPDFDPKGEHGGVRFDGIKALCYEGAPYKGMRTKVFAHIGFPENTENAVPAVVLIHGGGGHPEDKWIKKWTDRGYAAISMDTTGFFPVKKTSSLYEGNSQGLKRKLVPPFYEDGFTVPPDNSCMSDCHLPAAEQWMYHAVASVILAHNILRQDKRVDSDSIGVSGISWGGVITSIVTGYDSRFAFAIPIYGSGYLKYGLSALNEIFRAPDAVIWQAENRFTEVRMPVLWLCWNDDCFSLNGNSMSYLETRKNNRNTCLSAIHEMRHSHYDGYTPEENYWFADTVLSGKSVPEIHAEFTEGTVKYSCSEQVKAVRLFYLTEKMTYSIHEKNGSVNSFMDQNWQIKDLSPEKNSAPLPDNAVGRYVEFTLKNDIVLTTAYTEE